MPPRSKSASHEESVTASTLAKAVLPSSFLPSHTTSVQDALNINPFSKPNPILAPPPSARPPFTGDSIKAMIPAHCFERNTLTSFYHLFLDLAQVAVLGYAATYIHLAPTPAQVALWPLYWYVQGCVMTGLWVLAHECGHQAFSDSEFINNTVGWVVHSALLVPYHSWRITHKNHHSNTCSVEKDEVFAPYSHKEIAQEMMQDVPLMNLWNIVVMLTFGW
jgi:fatty acid desaturase